MRPVVVRILVAPSTARPDSPLGWLEGARSLVAERHRIGFEVAGADDVAIASEPADGRSFGARLRDLVSAATAANRGRRVGFVVLGGGSMPLARDEDRAAFVNQARAGSAAALANNRYSADALAVPDARMLADVPDLPSDNALPRWLAERRGLRTRDLSDRRRLAMDVDSPLDVLLLARGRLRARGRLLARNSRCPPELTALASEIGAACPAVMERIDGVARILADRRRELLVAGRTSAATLLWLRRNARCRVRALVEERGMRAGSPLALGQADLDARSDKEPIDAPRRIPEQERVALRPPRSVLGMLLDHRGASAAGEILAELCDAALLDTRVLLAHRLGADESLWPSPADRMASDLLRPDEIADTWLRTLTQAALESPLPILLGGHSLVGPGVPWLRGRR